MRKIIFVLLCLFMPQAIAGSFVAPETIVHEGKEYKLAYKSKADKQEMYEYTTNNEKVESWTSLITINYFKIPIKQAKDWVDIKTKDLTNEKPKPNYESYIKDTNSYFAIVYEPTPKYATFEVNAHKTYHLDSCDGFIVYQYAEQLKPKQNSEELKTQSDALKQKALVWTSSMEKDEWVPTCK